MPPTCAKICSLVKFLLVIAPLGQVAEQVPQPLHIASLMVETLFSISKAIALKAQSGIQVLHPEQISFWMNAVVGSMATLPLHITERTLAAAAEA